jgi:DNA invertase Pin-like site-specific DNA recombinase
VNAPAARDIESQLRELREYVTQRLAPDAVNPAGRLLLTVLAGVAEFEREVTCESTPMVMRTAVVREKPTSRARRFQRDELIRLREIEGLSWRAIARQLRAPVSTVRDVYGACAAASPRKTPRKAGRIRMNSARAAA